MIVPAGIVAFAITVKAVTCPRSLPETDSCIPAVVKDQKTDITAPYGSNIRMARRRHDVFEKSRSPNAILSTAIVANPLSCYTSPIKVNVPSVVPNLTQTVVGFIHRKMSWKI